MTEERRKNFGRRKEDERLAELIDEVKGLRKDLEDHVVADSKLMSAFTEDVSGLKEVFRGYHAENIARLAVMDERQENMAEKQRLIAGVNDDQLKLLEQLAQAKRVSISFGKAVKWLAGLAGALFAAWAGYLKLKA